MGQCELVGERVRLRGVLQLEGVRVAGLLEGAQLDVRDGQLERVFGADGVDAGAVEVVAAEVHGADGRLELRQLFWEYFVPRLACERSTVPCVVDGVDAVVRCGR